MKLSDSHFPVGVRSVRVPLRAEDYGRSKTLTLQEAPAELDSQSPTLVEARSRVADARAVPALPEAAVPLALTVLAGQAGTRATARTP